MTSPDPRGRTWEIDVCPKHGPTLAFDASAGWYCTHAPCSMASSEVQRITVTEVQSSSERELRSALGLARSIINSGEQPSEKASQQIDDALANSSPPAVDAWQAALSEPPKERDG